MRKEPMKRRLRVNPVDRLVQRHHARRDDRALRRARAGNRNAESSRLPLMPSDLPHLGVLTRGCDLAVDAAHMTLLDAVTIDRVRLAVLRNTTGPSTDITSCEARIEARVREARRNPRM